MVSSFTQFLNIFYVNLSFFMQVNHVPNCVLKISLKDMQQILWSLWQRNTLDHHRPYKKAVLSCLVLPRPPSPLPSRRLPRMRQSGSISHDTRVLTCNKTYVKEIGRKRVSVLFSSFISYNGTELMVQCMMTTSVNEMMRIYFWTVYYATFLLF